MNKIFLIKSQNLIRCLYKLKIQRLPNNLIELVIASPVKFNLTVPNNKTIQTKYYKLEKIGKYNIENNIEIEIPSNLSMITWWDKNASVYKSILVT